MFVDKIVFTAWVSVGNLPTSLKRKGDQYNTSPEYIRR